MQRTFSHILLITWFILSFGCKSSFVNTESGGQNVYVSDSVAGLDSQIIDVYLPYKKILEKDMSKVISVTGEEMVKDKPESALTNFLADLLLEEARFYADSAGVKIVPDISFFNYGGIRTFLPEGNITVGNIYELMPFENEMVFLELSGKELQEFLNIIAEKGGGSLGGVRFKISEKRATNVKIGNQPIDEHSNYWLVTNDYIAGGGDDMEVLANSSRKISSEKKIRDLIIAHLAKLHERNEIISVKTDGRISYE